MNKYVLIISMKPVFDCLDVTIRAKLRQTCKWCNKYIRRRLERSSAQLIIRRAWYHYKLHKNLCVSSVFTPVENLKLLVTKTNAHKIDNKFNEFPVVQKAFYLSNYTKTYNLANHDFKHLANCGNELVIPVYNERIGTNLDIVKSCYIKLFGNHKNLIIDILVNESVLISAHIPENAIAVRVHFGLLPMCNILYDRVNVRINHPIELERRYLHGVVLGGARRIIRLIEILCITNKIFIEAFYPDGSREIIGNVNNNNAIIYKGLLFTHF
jgi:hypothetical protein